MASGGINGTQQAGLFLDLLREFLGFLTSGKSDEEHSDGLSAQQTRSFLKSSNHS